MIKQYEKDLNSYRYDLTYFFNKEQEIFALVLGTIDLNKKYLSPFRPNDKNPKCEFKFYRGTLYFKDNVGYNGKLYFNCLDFIKHYYNYSFAETLQFIQSKLKVSYTSNQGKYTIPKSIINDESKRPIIIRFKYTPWIMSKPNLLLDELGFDHNYLNHEKVYLVQDYWCNSKKTTKLKKNLIYNPKNTETIAYHFEESDHTKLYFPEKRNFRFYTNCDKDDIFGWHRIKRYLASDDKTLAITKSGKDDLVLNYFLQLQSLGFQYETFSENVVSEKFMHILPEFDKLLLFWDKDDPGWESVKQWEAFLKNYHPNVIIADWSEKAGKDPAELLLNKQLNKITINGI